MNTFCHVFELMTRNPYCAHPDTPISELVKELVERKATAAPVLGEREVLEGLVSLVDVAVSPQARSVREIMQLRVHTVEHSSSLSTAARLMLQHRVHRLVVTDQDHVVGVLSCLDLLAGHLGVGRIARWSLSWSWFFVRCKSTRPARPGPLRPVIRFDAAAPSGLLRRRRRPGSGGGAPGRQPGGVGGSP